MNLEKTKKRSKKAFTLIELLVVITIMGILATGAIAVYTSQIQKARDATRINDVEALRSGVEQFYQDNNEYPKKGKSFSGVTVYTPKIPKDPKTGQSNDKTSFDYAYNVGKDRNEVDNQEFEISTAFENAGTTTSKAGGDGGNDEYRLEVGIDIGGNKTNIKGKQKVTSWVANPNDVGENVCVKVGEENANPTSCDNANSRNANSREDFAMIIR